MAKSKGLIKSLEDKVEIIFQKAEQQVKVENKVT